MNQRFAVAALVLGAAVVLSSANTASACFGLFNRGCCEPACGCDSGCGHRCCLFNLFHKHNCCEASCGCAEEASCGCAAEEASCGAPAEEASCGCAAEASCGCDSGCDSCCQPRRCCILSRLGRLFHRNRCCESSCGCEASCGCAAEAGCGCGG